jgi:prepilin-type N-terminal cleavage/methylation domain-containing protein/prepilin-type processing-associated H-X9-DG protein
MTGKPMLMPTTKTFARPSPGVPRGFSIVELLVVIGIIAILMAFLMPAMGLVGESGKQIRCISALRSMGQAAQSHVNDHDGYLPRAGWHWNPTGGIVNPAGLDDTKAIRYDYYREDDQLRPMPFTAALDRYMGVTVNTNSRSALEHDLQEQPIRRLFSCPAHEALPGWTQRDSNGWYSPDEYSSYVFNEAVLGRRDRESNDKPFPDGKIARVRDTTSVFLAMDGRTRDPVVDRCFLVFDFGPNDSVKDFDANIMTTTLGKELIDTWRHRRQINVLFLDGHVQTFSTEAGDLDRIGVSRGIQ